MIPEFNEHGELPPGIYRASMAEIEQRFAYNRRRRVLLDGLVRALRNLEAAGVRRVHVGGSYVTTKAMPGDIDGCWDVDAGLEVAKLDPVFLLLQPGDRLRMRRHYGLDFFPDVVGKWREDFQMTEDGRDKGILVLDLQTDALLERGRIARGGESEP